jgi:hypothetical protein
MRWAGIISLVLGCRWLAASNDVGMMVVDMVVVMDMVTRISAGEWGLGNTHKRRVHAGTSTAPRITAVIIVGRIWHRRMGAFLWRTRCMTIASSWTRLTTPLVCFVIV